MQYFYIKILFLAWRRALADFKSKQATSVLGVAWHIVHPLSLIVVFTLVFSGLLGQRIYLNGTYSNYSLFLCAGLFPWLAFHETIVSSCQTLIVNSHYIRKMPVSELVFFFESLFATLIVFFISFGVFLLIVFFFGDGFHLSWLCLPLPIVLMAIIALELGLIFGLLNVFYRDVSMFVQISLQVLMWSTPIIYPVSIIPIQYQFITALSPMTPIVNIMRDLTLFGILPNAQDLIISICWILALGAICVILWKRLSPIIRDNL